MAGLYSLDIVSEIIDDVALAWDDPDFRPFPRVIPTTVLTATPLPLPSAYIQLGSPQPSVVEQVPIPRLLLGIAAPQPLPLANVQLGAPQPSIVEQVPIFVFLRVTNLIQPVPLASNYTPPFLPGQVETIPVPQLLTSTGQPFPKLPDNLATILLPGVVETVPVPITLGNVPGLLLAPTAVVQTGLTPGQAAATPILALFTQDQFRQLDYRIRAQITYSLIPGTPPAVLAQLPIWPTAYPQTDGSGSGVSEWPFNIMDTTNA